MRLNRLLAPLALLVIAGTAWALTEQSLQAEADALSVEFAGLAFRIDNCPGGACGSSAQIVSDFAAAGNDLDGLVADRASLPGCTCTSVDAAIAGLELSREEGTDIINDWTQAPGRDGRTQPKL